MWKNESSLALGESAGWNRVTRGPGGFRRKLGCIVRPWLPSAVSAALLLLPAGPLAAADSLAHPLFVAFDKGNLSLFANLVDAGADPTAYVERRVRFIEYGGTATATYLHFSIVEGKKGLFEFLLDPSLGLDLDAKVTEAKLEWMLGSTPLHWAARIGSGEAVNALIETGADVNAVDKRGYKPITWAAWGEHVDLFMILIADGDTGQ